MAAAAQAQAQEVAQPLPWAGDQNQWEITWHEPNRPPEVLIVHRFANAWGRAQPPAADDEPGWTYTRRADIWPLLVGAQTVRVAWREDDGTFTTLRRM